MTRDRSGFQVFTEVMLSVQEISQANVTKRDQAEAKDRIKNSCKAVTRRNAGK